MEGEKNFLDKIDEIRMQDPLEARKEVLKEQVASVFGEYEDFIRGALVKAKEWDLEHQERGDVDWYDTLIRGGSLRENVPFIAKSLVKAQEYDREKKLITSEAGGTYVSLLNLCHDYDLHVIKIK